MTFAHLGWIPKFALSFLDAFPYLLWLWLFTKTVTKNVLNWLRYKHIKLYSCFERFTLRGSRDEEQMEFTCEWHGPKRACTEWACSWQKPVDYLLGQLCSVHRSQWRQNEEGGSTTGGSPGIKSRPDCTTSSIASNPPLVRAAWPALTSTDVSTFQTTIKVGLNLIIVGFLKTLCTVRLPDKSLLHPKPLWRLDRQRDDPLRADHGQNWEAGQGLLLRHARAGQVCLLIGQPGTNKPNPTNPIYPFHSDGNLKRVPQEERFAFVLLARTSSRTTPC